MRTYASRHQLQIAERLGFGIHGMVHVVENKTNGDQSAVKAHVSAVPYLREQFEVRWPIVQAVLRELETLGIYMQDVSPSNIAFVD